MATRGTNHIKRFAGAGNVDHHLEQLFGTREYLNVPASGREEFLHDLYGRQLQAVARFRYVRSFAMENRRGHTSYHLYYCTNHLAGLKKMKAAMWKVAPEGDYRFRDKMADQAVLFDAEPPARSESPRTRSSSSRWAARRARRSRLRVRPRA